MKIYLKALSAEKAGKSCSIVLNSEAVFCPKYWVPQSISCEIFAINWRPIYGKHCYASCYFPPVAVIEMGKSSTQTLKSDVLYASLSIDNVRLLVSVLDPKNFHHHYFANLSYNATKIV